MHVCVLEDLVLLLPTAKDKRHREARDLVLGLGVRGVVVGRVHLREAHVGLLARQLFRRVRVDRLELLAVAAPGREELDHDDAAITSNVCRERSRHRKQREGCV